MNSPKQPEDRLRELFSGGQSVMYFGTREGLMNHLRENGYEAEDEDDELAETFIASQQ